MVIEHINNPVLFVEKVFHILKPNGLVVLNTINSGALIHYIARLLKAFSFRGAFDRLYSHHHLQHYNNKSLANLVKDGGFEIISHKNHNFPLKSVDLPKTNTLIKWIYVSGVAIVFCITNLFGGGLCQTIICKK